MSKIRRRRRSGVPSNAITKREETSKRERCPLSLLLFSFLLSVARARARATAQDEAWNRGEDTFFRVSLTSPREYTTTTRRSRVIPLLERELRGLGHAVGSRDPPHSFSPARIVRGGGRARARAPLREITAGTPLIPGRRRRRRETALTPLSGRPPRSFRTTPRAARDGGPLLLPRRGSVSSTIRRGFGAASRARSSRANVQRSLVRARQVRRRASSLWLLKRPSARRGPGIVSVDRNVRSKCRCSCVLQFTS